jgi:hypothetical protein
MNAVAGQTEATILAIVHERKSILFEELLACLPESTWNQVFIGVDTLSRQGAVCLRRRGIEYELRAPALPTTSLAAGTITPSLARFHHLPNPV